MTIPPTELPDNSQDYCVTCDGIHSAERHEMLVQLFLEMSSSEQEA